MKKALITGANRGIGLELVRELKSNGYQVFGVCRKASDELRALISHIVENIDVSSKDCKDQLQSQLKGETFDVVINCAGLLEGMTINNIDYESIDRQFQINAVGPLRVIEALLGQLASGAKIIMVTSRMGSVEDNTSGGSYGYRMSKAALNIASKSLAEDLKGRKIAVGIVHPGYVRTAMTGFNGHIDSAQSAQGICQRLNGLNTGNTGTFWHQNGEILPW
jgi:NAD(P)-dependent dehydrogenase (short-subunit alcohol dehydrogenase family)